MKRRAGIPIIKREKTPTLRKAYELNEHLNKNIKHPASGRAIQGRQKRPNESVCKGKDARV